MQGNFFGNATEDKTVESTKIASGTFEDAPVSKKRCNTLQDFYNLTLQSIRKENKIAQVYIDEMKHVFEKTIEDKNTIINANQKVYEAKQNVKRVAIVG